ncbi:hypothetical protein KIL84_012488 [Mauremys mutica]|uniref:Uncharacterized protein n=1 Tax=Mauremys mutica TaxID=74926 RepID=A0A9D3XRI7_9SAUR|nr:hypothetical protein KIL84_012488 [Mauremys mutica]
MLAKRKLVLESNPPTPASEGRAIETPAGQRLHLPCHQPPQPHAQHVGNEVAETSETAEPGLQQGPASGSQPQPLPSLTLPHQPQCHDLLPVMRLTQPAFVHLLSSGLQSSPESSTCERPQTCVHMDTAFSAAGPEPRTLGLP